MLACKELIVSFLVSGLFPCSYISSDADDSILKRNQSTANPFSRLSFFGGKYPPGISQ